MTSSVVAAMVVGRAVSSVVAAMVVATVVFTGIIPVFTDLLTKPLPYTRLLRPNTRALLLVLAAHIVETLPFLMLLGDQLVVLCGKKIYLQLSTQLFSSYFKSGSSNKSCNKVTETLLL